MTAEAIGEHLKHQYPSRFRPTTLHSTAQNLASSWTQAGYLHGKVKKGRVKPESRPSLPPTHCSLGISAVLRGKLCWTANGLASWTAGSPYDRTHP